MPLALKINYPGGTVVLRGLADDCTLGQLKDKVSESVPDFPPAEQKYKCGFPPSDVEGSDAVLLSELGIKSGTALSLSRKAPGDIVSDATLPPPPAKDASGPATLPAPPSSDTASSESGQGERLKRRLMEMGFSERVAKKALEMSDQNLEAAFEMCLGGVITEESLGPESSNGGRSSEAANTGRSQRMVRRVIDADNSCLFNAIGYLMERDLKSGSRLRRLIADTVLSNPYTYNEAMLGKPPREYATWILKPETWGGEIELFILSQHFRVEIVAIEIRSLHCYSYGEEHSYPRRIFVLYDGVHYDAIAESSSPDAAASSDVTQFPSSDGSKKEAALALAAEAKARRQYVDLAGCTLRCMVCDKAFKGQKEAIQHASVTKHQNFGEV